MLLKQIIWNITFRQACFYIKKKNGTGSQKLHYFILINNRAILQIRREQDALYNMHPAYTHLHSPRISFSAKSKRPRFPATISHFRRWRFQDGNRRVFLQEPPIGESVTAGTAALCCSTTFRIEPSSARDRNVNAGKTCAGFLFIIVILFSLQRDNFPAVVVQSRSC